MRPLSKRLSRFFELLSVFRMGHSVAAHAQGDRARLPVVFFNASTRISGLSQNAAFSLLASWMLRLSGVRVIHFICWSGMSHCVLGTDQDAPENPMPCQICTRQSRVNTSGAEKRIFTYQPDADLISKLLPLPLDQLLTFEQPLPDGSGSLPLGTMILPSLRWRMRLLTLTDDEMTRFLCREFILSAWNVALKFMALLENAKPQAVVVFNGKHFPEATAAWISRQRGVRVITHESGFQPFSGYFVQGDVTAYPINIPDVDLTVEENARLDADLQKRLKGDFSMAGIRFWDEMRSLPQDLTQKAAGFKNVVAIFTNVIFDTTQLNANVIFTDMFAWLDMLLQVCKTHPETLFVFRAHPDEARPGKASRESVAMWFEQKASKLPNTDFIAPEEGLNSYELIRLAKFILTYNSQIGLEAMLMGVPALGAGRAPFVDYGTVFFEKDQAEYMARLDTFLTAEKIEIPEELIRRIRRFMFYRYYLYSLPFGEFIEPALPTGYVRLKRFPWKALRDSPTTKAFVDGILREGIFHLHK